MSEEHADVIEKEDKPDAQEAEHQAAEARARELGWVPKSEWRGDPEVWTDAAEWLEKGDKLLGSQLRQTQSRLSAIESEREVERADFEKRIKRMERMQQQREERLREQMERDFEARIRDAASKGDSEALEAALKDRKEAAKKPSTEEEEEKPEVRLSTAQRDWLSDNKSWYNVDKDMTRAANAIAEVVEAKMPAASEKEKLEAISERMREEFPEKFGVKKQTRSRVEGGNRYFESGNGSADGKQFAKLPPEAKQQFQADVKAGLYKKEDGEAWAAAYFA